jgi:PLP dependent protein
MNTTIQENYQQIRERVSRAAQGREVRIVAVSKTMPPEKMEQAYTAGVGIFGENRIQEAIPKIQMLSGLDVEWHFVGHLQTNKAREAVRYFSCVHSVDSIRLMEMIEKEAMKINKSMDLLLELNLSEETSKHGMKVDQLQEALQTAQTLTWGKVRGLMILPPYLEDPEKVRPYFRQLRKLRDQHATHFPALIELSMGMSHDYIVAVEEGATMIRIGTALFGERKL